MDIQFTVNSQDEFEIDEALALLFEIKERVQRPVESKSQSMLSAAKKIEAFIDEVVPMPGERQLSTPIETQIAGAIGTVDITVAEPKVFERVDPATITRELATKKGVKEAADVLKEFGAKRVNEIAEDRKAAYVAEVQKRLAA